MKKLYFLLFSLLMTSLSYGQGSEDFTNSNAGSSYSDNNFVGNGGITWSYVASRDANGDANSSGINLPALMLRRVSSGSKITSSTISGGIGDFSVKLYKGFTGGGDRQVELFVNGVSQGVSDPFDDFNEHVFTVSGINIGGDITIEIVNPNAKQVIIDDITWTGFAGQGTPSIAITSPSNNAEFAPGTTSVDVSVSVQNFNVGNTASDDGYIVGTLTTPTGTFTEDKFDTNDQTISVADGETHTITYELVDTNGASLNPAVITSVTFSVLSATTVANIAALRAGTIGNTYQLTNEALITYLTGFRNQKHIEDATGGILIDDQPGAITSTYAVGDGITGLVGTLGEYNNTLQFIPLSDPGAASSTGNTLPFQTVTLADLTANPENYESELVKVTGVTFDNTETNFNNALEIAMTQGTDMFNFRTAFNEDYSQGTIPTVPADVTGVILDRSGNYFLMARYASDFSVDVLSVDQVNTAKFSLYPNPTNTGYVTISSLSSDAISVQVYDILGKKVKNETLTNNTLNVSNLNKGVYIVKITQNNASITKKLVIK